MFYTVPDVALRHGKVVGGVQNEADDSPGREVNDGQEGPKTDMVHTP